MAPLTMRALVSSPEGPTLTERPRPTPGPNQVLVRVHAAPLNRADLAMLRGASHGAVGGLGAPLGLEWAGQIAGLGEGVSDWKIGDRVMGAGGGAFADYTLGHQALMHAVPPTLDFASAATLPVALQTMHDAVATHGALQKGQSVLILGASSGVGLMGLQIARALGAGLVIGSSTSPEKRARLPQFGADLTVDTGHDGWVDEILAATEGKGVDVVIDQLAGPLFNTTMRATRIGGRIVNVGRMAGESAPIDFDLHSMRRITYVGVTFRTRSGRGVAELVQRARADLAPAIADGRLALPIDARFDLTDAPAAFEKMAANRHFGKIILTTG
ncbi:zinc-binding dehydrogenase [Phenylobacterium sp.]|uniref:quinone oxidoreductase family protein n=1 Tax=Phenylobacterium sp. TaxID=1871053 RepID=UPI0025EEDF16|nr:zinc-binding dehydrogenase [Phenylobacterium sp.]